MSLNRRNFLLIVGATVTSSAAILANLPKTVVAQEAQPQAEDEPQGPFEFTPLPYGYDGLEPTIDTETMKFHHDEHYRGYINKLNKAVSDFPVLASQSAEDILREIDNLPEAVVGTIRDNGGGYVNHKMFWEIMSPDGGGEPTGEIATAINETFGSFAAFQEQFNEAGRIQFGSGWAWLVFDEKEEKLKIRDTANQDSPFSENMYPIMGNDVWEHAYYLKYKNKRDEYLKNWWNVVNWDAINQRYQQAIAKA